VARSPTPLLWLVVLPSREQGSAAVHFDHLTGRVVAPDS
jgi:hypothetical protein